MNFLRIGTVQYLNAQILNYGFFLVNSQRKPSQIIKSLNKYNYSIIQGTPSFLVEQLLQKKIDIGLISTVEALRNKDQLNYYPKLGICSFKKVQSILYIKRSSDFYKPVKKIYLDKSSRSSIALLKILYYKTFQEIPEFTLEEPKEILKKIDSDSAGLLIGDPALDVYLNPNSFFLKDLCDWWYEITQLPFVFAVWSFPKELNFDTNIFEESYEIGQAHLQEIIQSSRYLESFAKSYLTEIIYHRITAKEEKSIFLFEQFLKEMDWI
ncbi:MAG: menaquinone biosynthesis protein [Leptonema sp. (in: bacteria)]